jgi:hypothetical protein
MQLLLGAGVLATAVQIHAQQGASSDKPDPKSAAPTVAAPAVPVRIDVTIVRSKGVTKVSSLPYSMHGVSGSSSRIRLASSVPVANAKLDAAMSYQQVGTNLDCDVTVLAPGQYRLGLALMDSSLISSGISSGGERTGVQNSPVLPVIQSYSLNTTLVLRDAQSQSVNVATDKATGETIEIQVVVTAIK